MYICVCVYVCCERMFIVMHLCGCGCVWCCSFCVPCMNVHIMHENYLSLLCSDVCRLLSLAVGTIQCSVFYLYMLCACYLSINLNSRMFKLECHSLVLQLVQFIKIVYCFLSLLNVFLNTHLTTSVIPGVRTLAFFSHKSQEKETLCICINKNKASNFSTV